MISKETKFREAFDRLMSLCNHERPDHVLAMLTGVLSDQVSGNAWLSAADMIEKEFKRQRERAKS